jgi:membrane protein
VALAIYFASSGIESLRIGLNRAYGVVETRNWLLLRRSIAYVLVAAVALLALAFDRARPAAVFDRAQICAHACAQFAPLLAPLEWNFTVALCGDQHHPRGRARAACG